MPAAGAEAGAAEEVAVDVTPLLELRPAPRAVLDRLSSHADRPRFWVRGPGAPPGGAWQPVTWGQYARQIRGVARWLIELIV